MVRPLRREGALLVLLTFLSIMVTEGVGAELDTDSLSHAPHSGGRTKLIPEEAKSADEKGKGDGARVREASAGELEANPDHLPNPGTLSKEGAQDGTANGVEASDPVDSAGSEGDGRVREIPEDAKSADERDATAPSTVEDDAAIPEPEAVDDEKSDDGSEEAVVEADAVDAAGSADQAERVTEEASKMDAADSKDDVDSDATSSADSEADSETQRITREAVKVSKMPDGPAKTQKSAELLAKARKIDAADGNVEQPTQSNADSDTKSTDSKGDDPVEAEKEDPGSGEPDIRPDDGPVAAAKHPVDTKKPDAAQPASAKTDSTTEADPVDASSNSAVASPVIEAPLVAEKEPAEAPAEEPVPIVETAPAEPVDNAGNSSDTKPKVPKPYIPFHPTIPKLSVKEQMSVKGVLKMESTKTRQLHINHWADLSASSTGASVFGGNMHVVTNKKEEFRYSNDHGEMGAIGFATNYPHYNKASVISSKTKASKQDQTFKPESLVTFTGSGDVGIGVAGPASRLHVQGDGNTRLINANHWLDASGCSSGVGLVGGNSYVTTTNGKAQFRYANSHSSIGAFGLAFNYPAWNKASIISSVPTESKAKQQFKPLVVQTYTNDGKVGIGTDEPPAHLAIKGKERQFTVNDWIDVSSNGATGFMGANAHLVKKSSEQVFTFSNTDTSTGATGIATNYPDKNKLSIVASAEASSKKGASFKPRVAATFTNEGRVGLGSPSPNAKLAVHDKQGRQSSVNDYADVSANDNHQAFFGGNGYTIGNQFSYSNTNSGTGAIGLATHYPKPNSASIISSGPTGGKAGSAFEPQVLAEFKPDGSLQVQKDIVVKGDLRVGGRIIYDDSASDNSQPQQQYDMLKAHEALVEENMKLHQRLERMEQAMMTMQATLEAR